jgi:hypothetical protein
MGEIVNLRQARKTKARGERERQAEANRAKHGRSKADKRLADLARQKHDAVVDGAFRERGED